MSRKFSFDHIYSNEVCGCHQSALKENFRVRGQCHNDECSLTLQMSDVSTAVSRVRFGEMCEQSHTRWIHREHLDGGDAGVAERLEPPRVTRGKTADGRAGVQHASC